MMPLQRVRIKQVDAFTKTAFAGNPAGVVTAAEGLSDEQMQLIAREMNLSETAFVLSARPAGGPATTVSADLRLRWFTPTMEVDLCGHATIATFHALCEEGKFGLAAVGSHQRRLETRSGVLTVQVENSGDGSPRILFSLPVPKFEPVQQGIDKLCRALHLDRKELHPDLPVVKHWVNTILPVKRLKTVLKLQPDFTAVKKVSEELNVYGLTPLTLETVEPESKVHIRFFGPRVGVNEDPVTGAAQGSVGVYLFEQGVLQGDEEILSYIGEQGDAIDRPGRVLVRVHQKADKVTGVEIGGYAVTVFEGEIFL